MKRKILVVDDEASFCTAVKEGLEASGGFEVTVCQEATEALQEARRVRPDLILLDVMMPSKLGMEVAKQLRRQEETRRIALIYLTALPLEQEEEAFLIKPIRLEALRAKIEEVLSKSPGGPAP